MTVLGVVLLVIFVIVAVLLILLVLAQNEEGDGMGGIFAGGSSTAFGSRSGNILTRITTVLGALFLVISLGMALLSKTPSGSGVEEAGLQQLMESDNNWWRTEQENRQPEPVYDYSSDVYQEPYVPGFSLDFGSDDNAGE